MQTNMVQVLDVICVGPGGGSPDGLLFPLLLSTGRDLVVQNKCILYFLPNTSLHGIAEHGLALSKVSVKKKKVPFILFDI